MDQSAYKNPYLEAERQRALLELGPKWLLAPTLRCRDGVIIPSCKGVSPAKWRGALK